MKVRFFLAIGFLFIWAPAFTQTSFEKQLQNFLEQPAYRNASVGIQVVESATGKTFFEHNPEQLFIPASVLKVVTSAAALEILGADYHFKTKLGYSGKIENGVLKGNLVIVGGGDPSLGSEYFRNYYPASGFLETWAAQVRAAGIQKVEGHLVLDCSLYDTEPVPPTWIWEDMGNYYGAGASALTFYDNLFRISFRSQPKAGLPTEIVAMRPQIKGLTMRNEVLSSDSNRDLAYVFGSPFDGDRVVRGTIPKNRKSFTIRASNPFPEKLLADDFLAHLARKGIFVSGDSEINKVEPADFKLIYVTESPSLAEIVKVLNHESVNLFAEHLVKQVAAEKNGTGTRESGLNLIVDFWKSKGLDVSQLIMEDGSGLSHFNAVSPAFLVSVLNYMDQSGRYSDDFWKSLPSAGNGTLHYFDPRLFPQNSLRAKSGSMTRVRCYIGYISPEPGKRYSFSVMVNHFSGSHLNAIAEIEKLLYEVYRNGK
ncbi:D-alanyl-D-alanine carboxypeptidase / D-alanyl-D-alanine-endopeptidase (penicillin-binding protein 4) [Mariniphaga anaerophila]|uniref:D-alanyl-D-alanine carboxypeptidase / D-alanyl-D-alanine-endopeptidase (Penicillin-binding protein 4) n=1 Tax=Mariniphaga anaerophila TaxID=1484053 RepID=A0A1M5E503_9BACT|nr:D-alanyl-D-alanine carboxypeptidase/D-alanyl-D-alanine-endopeptidase [Mariniphaga anaerophila]SHF74317.1 D-alanyl-D-alanine carboxypeptidase / D-alanyl-D-alanine-endopeptidase (penicillin-binding protein 4) [Mariniphaga anaerophila]